jgi:tellurite resistance protein
MKLYSMVIGAVMAACAFAAQAQSEPQGAEPASTATVAKKKSHVKSRAKHVHKAGTKKHHKAKHKVKKSASI